MVERLLHWYGSIYKLVWVALRYFNAAGVDPDGELGEDHDPETHLIPLAISAAIVARLTWVPDRGTQFRTWWRW